MNQSGNHTIQEILVKFEDLFLKEEKICKRMLEFFEDDKNFLLDSTGTNIDELENIHKKINQLVLKLIEILNKTLNNIIVKYELDIAKRFIIFTIEENDNLFDIHIDIEDDGFLMEIKQ
ncbi:MAG: hypothetical protein RBQ81_06230 [Arcobacteraceae bacterium]|jgi:hypothetical protein|nr:hypothetical protein [Arcobacteraceae bacterium]